LPASCASTASARSGWAWARGAPGNGSEAGGGGARACGASLRSRRVARSDT
jgi:hypothetical protein